MGEYEIRATVETNSDKVSDIEAAVVGALTEGNATVTKLKELAVFKPRDMSVLSEFIHLRVFAFPCCGRQLCWVGPRLPNYCPECGDNVFVRLKQSLEATLFSDNEASLDYRTKKEKRQ